MDEMRKNKLIIGAAAVCMISSFFVANVPLDGRYAGISAAAVLLFAWPTYNWMIKWLGVRRGVAVLSIFGVFALVLESVAIKTGFPYGRFTYNETLGTMVFGLTPWTVAFAWPPLVFGTYAVATRLTYRAFMQVLAAVALLVAVDIVLDPGSVALGFWRYDSGGFFYQVPLSNFLGWVGSGLAGVLLLRSIIPPHGRSARPPRGILLSVLFITLFWTSVCFWLALWIPFGVGTVLTGFFWYHYKYGI